MDVSFFCSGETRVGTGLAIVRTPLAKFRDDLGGPRIHCQGKDTAPRLISEAARRSWTNAGDNQRRILASQIMPRTRLQPASLPDPVRYSHGFRVGNTVYLAGALGTEADSSVSPDIRLQTRRAFEKLATVMREAGGGLSDVVKLTVFITDMRWRESYGEVRAEFFPHDAPASTLVQVVALADPAALIEIEAVAVLD